MTNTELLLYVCMHPKVYCAAIKTTRDLIIFLCGVCCSPEHLHGDDLGGFSAYLHRRLKRPPRLIPWSAVLLEELGNKSLKEGCEVIAGLLQDWLASQAVEKNDIE